MECGFVLYGRGEWEALAGCADQGAEAIGEATGVAEAIKEQEPSEWEAEAIGAATTSVASRGDSCLHSGRLRDNPTA